MCRETHIKALKYHAENGHLDKYLVECFIDKLYYCMGDEYDEKLRLQPTTYTWYNTQFMVLWCIQKYV